MRVEKTVLGGELAALVLTVAACLVVTVRDCSPPRPVYKHSISPALGLDHGGQDC